ncbi:DUF3617 domain-containing protein [Sphingomonas tabacisoli]|uniref:DUF3617 domain-containing protein n=1 Tax=Sphingomonas tabacisoli TaxID=2249466 RepID=A0ABW4HYF4_9SPHN
MRMTIALALLALTACNKGPTVKVKDATPAEVAQQVKKSGVVSDVRLQPGQWQVVTQAKLQDASGMPPQVAEQMKAAMARTSTETQCLTPEQVAKPNSDMFAGKQNSQCKYDKFEMGGGKIKAEMHCPGGAGAQMAMTMDGSYSPTSYTMDAAMDMQTPGNGGMKMAVHTEGKRIGECVGGGATSGK